MNYLGPFETCHAKHTYSDSKGRFRHGRKSQVLTWRQSPNL